MTETDENLLKRVNRLQVRYEIIDCKLNNLKDRLSNLEKDLGIIQDDLAQQHIILQSLAERIER